MDTKLIQLLKTEQNLDLSNLKNRYSYNELTKGVNAIIKSDAELELVKEIPQYKFNLLTLISYLITVEQNNLLKSDQSVSLESKKFDDEFMKRVNALL